MVNIHLHIAFGTDCIDEVIVNHHLVRTWLVDQEENINDIIFIDTRNIISFSFYRFDDLSFSKLFVSFFHGVSGEKTGFAELVDGRDFFSDLNFPTINSIQNRLYNLFIFRHSGVFIDIDFKCFCHDFQVGEIKTVLKKLIYKKLTND
jgi:hypothetical protein